MQKNVNKKRENDLVLCVPRNNHEGFTNFKYQSEYICK